MIVDCAAYREGRRVPTQLRIADAGKAAAEPGTFVWIGLYEPTTQEFDEVRSVFGLHELAVEDAVRAHQRPKLETYGDTLFMVLRTARYVDPEEVVSLGEIQLFIGNTFLVAVRHGPQSALSGVRRQVEAEPEFLAHGTGAVVHGIIDRVVDDYLPVVNGMETDIEELESRVFSPARENQAERIYKLKREVLEFHQAVSPLLDPLDQLARGRNQQISPEIRHYFRDVHDHTVRVTDRLATFRDRLTSILEANLIHVSLRQNEDMRRISAWVAIAAVPTAVAGIYGMNFEHMPELKVVWGYPLVLGVIGLICLYLYHRFKQSGWL